MGMFRMAHSVMLYDSTDDEKRMYNKALDLIEKSKTIGEWIAKRLRLQEISIDPISIQQYKSDIKKILADEKWTPCL